MKSLVQYYCELPTVVRRPLWRIWHNMLIRYDQDVTANFLNYGYQGLNGDAKLELKPEDEPNRFCIQLYDHVVNEAPIEGKFVLEVGSGRGGGAAYISRYYNPKKYIAVDISARTIDFCNKYYKIPNLSFLKGVAENLPIPSNSQDVVVNVESARCYKSLTAFFNEVNRVLRPEGYFMFADMIETEDVESVKSKLAECGLTVVKERVITPNVAKALELDSKRRQEMIDSKTPKFLRKSFAQFAGTEGSERYESFRNGKFQYMSFVIRKN